MIFWKLPFSKEQNGLVKRKEVEDFFNNKYVINYEVTSFAPVEIIDIIKRMLKPIPIDRITWKEMKVHLIRHLGVEEHEFLDMKDLMSHFNQILGLLIKAAKVMKSGIDKGVAFWKVNRGSKIETYETFVHYIFICAIRFRARQKYRWHLASAAHQSLAEQVIKEASAMETAICKLNEIEEFEVKDFSFMEMKVLEKIEVLRD